MKHKTDQRQRTLNGEIEWIRQTPHYNMAYYLKRLAQKIERQRVKILLNSHNFDDL